MGFKRVEKSCERCGATYLAHRPTQQFCSYTCSAQARIAPTECSIDGCARPVQARGWCDPHYRAWRRTGDPAGWKANPERRFWEKVEKGDECWLWVGRLSGGGYGQFRVDGRQVMAHRYSYELHVGSIPDDLELDHLCRVRSCVRPEHLEAVTRSVNVARGIPYADRPRRARCVDCGAPVSRAAYQRCRGCSDLHRYH